MEQNRRSGGSGWLGWVLFFVLIFGSRFAPPVANWLSQVTGMNITASGIMGTLAILYIASLILGPILGMLFRNVGNDSPAPTMPDSTGSPNTPMTSSKSPFPQSAPPPVSMPSQGMSRLPPTTSAKTPGAPRWEPVLDPRVLVFGIVGLVLFGGFFILVLLLTGAI